MIRRVVTLLFGAVLSTLLMVTTGGNAWACSCAAASLKDQLAGSTAVFVGTPIARDTLGVDDTGIVSSTDPIRWTFEVETVHRGSVQAGQEVYAARSDASCGVQFQIGVSYLVMAYQQPDGLWTGTCSGTTPIVYVSAGDLTALGEGDPPAPVSASATAPSGQSEPGVTSVVSGAVVATTTVGEGRTASSPPQDEDHTVILWIASGAILGLLILTVVVRQRRARRSASPG